MSTYNHQIGSLNTLMNVFQFSVWCQLVYIVSNCCVSAISYGYKCNDTQLAAIEKADVVKLLQHSRCPKRGSWFRSAVHQSLKRPNITIVSIGCNKGDDLISLMEAWSGNTTYNVTAYVQHMRADFGKLHFACGKAAKHYPRFLQQTVRHVRGFCVEPMPINQKLLRSTMYDGMKFSPEVLKVVPAAVDMLPGVALFPNFLLPGVEHLGLGNIGASGSQAIPVNVTNVDQLLADEGLDIVDLLSIDAEGYDGRVLLGAAQSLASGKIRMLEFEYGKTGPWKTLDLSMIVEYLDVLQYDCFWMGDGGELWRLTGCWMAGYKDKADWSNVVCVHRVLEAATHRIFTDHSTIFDRRHE